MTANIICPDYKAKESEICAHFISRGFCSSLKWFRCIEFIRRNKPIMSHSAVDSFVRCKYNFYMGWIKGWRTTKVNLAPTTGNLMHAYFATFHADNDHDVKRAEKSIAKYRAELVDPYSETGEMVLAAQIVPYLFQGYRKACRDGKIRDLKGRAESPFIVEHDNFTLKARMDLDMGDEIVDYKYVSNPDNYTFFSTRFQATIYLSLHEQAQKITFRCIRRPKLRQGKNETVQDYLERIRQDIYGRPGFYVKDETYYRSEYQFDKRLAEIGRMAGEIADHIDDPEFWWQASSERCLTPWKCDFYDACTSGVWSEQIYKQSTYDVGPEGSKG